MTHHDDKCEAVVEDEPKWVLESFEAGKIGALHQGIGHGLDDEDGVASDLVIGIIESNEGLKEADDDDG